VTEGELKRFLRLGGTGLIGRTVLIAFVLAVHALIWTVAREKTFAPDVHDHLASLSYSPLQRHPEPGYKPTVEQIRADLKNIVGSALAIRIYSSTGGVELVPAVATEVGLRLTVGAWIGPNKQQNQAELRSAIDLVRKNRKGVSAVVVGNETIYRGEPALFEHEADDKTALFGDSKLSDEEQQRLVKAREGAERNRVREDINVAHLIEVIKRVKRETDGKVPVTGGSSRA
jgi:hypothetical protein